MVLNLQFNSDVFWGLCSLFAYSDQTALPLFFSGPFSDWQFGKSFYDDTTGLKAYTLYNKSKTEFVIVFEGTEFYSNCPNCGIDIYAIAKASLTFNLSYGKVNQTLYNAWNNVNIKDSIKNWIQQTMATNSPINITLTGHSLGGSMALVAAGDIGNISKCTKIITFGAFMVGDKNYVDYLSSSKFYCKCHIEESDKVISNANLLISLMSPSTYATNPNEIWSNSGAGHSINGYILVEEITSPNIPLSLAEYYTPFQNLIIATETSYTKLSTPSERYIDVLISGASSFENPNPSIGKLDDSTKVSSKAPHTYPFGSPNEMNVFKLSSVPVAAIDLVGGLIFYNNNIKNYDILQLDSAQVFGDGLVLGAGKGLGCFDHSLITARMSMYFNSNGADFNSCIQWTSPLTSCTSGTWKNAVTTNKRVATGICVSQNSGAINDIQMSYYYFTQLTYTNWTADSSPPNTIENDLAPDYINDIEVLESPLTGIIDIKFTTSNNKDSGWLRGSTPGTYFTTYNANIPPNSAVVGLQGMMSDTRLVDIKIAYVPL